MSQVPGPSADAVASALDEESRYQAICLLDLSHSENVTILLERLVDPSWRVRMAVVERLGTLPAPAPFLPALLDIFCSTGQDPGARNAAAAALIRFGAGAVEVLLERLRSSSPEIRNAVAEVLGEIRDRRSVCALCERLEDPDPNVRSAAAEALGKVGGAEAIRALMRAVAGGAQAPRLAALDAFERLRVKLPVALLGELVRDRALRRPAYRLLGLSDEPAGQAILARGAFEESRSCREAALAAIGQQCLRSSRTRLGSLAQAVRAAAGSAGAASMTASALSADDWSVTAGALRVLGWIGDVRYVPQVAVVGEAEDLRPVVLEALQDMGVKLRTAVASTLPELSPGARITVILALARLGDTSVFEELVAVLNSEYDSVCCAAIEGLGRLGDLRAVPLLAEKLDHADDTVAGSAAAALATIASLGEAEWRRVLEHCRQARSHPPVALVRLLSQLGDASDVPALTAALKDPSAETRAAAAAGLQVFGARGVLSEFLPELLDALADPAPTVRAAAAQALGTLARSVQPSTAVRPLGEEVARELAANLHDGEPMVQAAAAQALGRCHLMEYAGALAESAVSPKSAPEVVAAAIRALAELGDPDPVVLEQASRHPDPEVVKEAVWAAAGVLAVTGSQVLVAAAVHPRWDVRRAAAQAIAVRGDRSLLETVQRLAASEEDPMAAEAFTDAVRALMVR